LDYKTCHFIVVISLQPSEYMTDVIVKTIFTINFTSAQVEPVVKYNNVLTRRNRPLNNC